MWRFFRPHPYAPRTGISPHFPLLSSSPPNRGRDIYLPGGRPPVNVLRNGGRSPDGPTLGLCDFAEAGICSWRTRLTFEARRFLAVHRSSMSSARPPISKEEVPAARRCRLECDESSPLAPKKQRGPPVRRSYALLNPPYSYPNSEARLEMFVVTKLQQWVALDRAS